jgi:hypothetical protein
MTIQFENLNNKTTWQPIMFLTRAAWTDNAIDHMSKGTRNSTVNSTTYKHHCFLRLYILQTARAEGQGVSFHKKYKH